MIDSRTLVVGADSRIGGALLRARGAAIGTTRRRETLSSTRLFLDLSQDVEHFKIPSDVDSAFLVAATTGIERCETDPTSWTVNVTSACRLSARLLQQGCFVTFLSTNAVFGGDRSWPDEDDPVAPTAAYARQKAEAEQAIQEAADRLGAADRLSITRLTKTLAPDTPPLPGWFQQLKRGDAIEPFEDLVMSPISLEFVTSSLLRIGALRVPGILHLSGERDVTYVEFAEGLIDRLGLPRARVVPTTSIKAGVAVQFRPRYGGLGMRRTTQLAQIYPEPLEHVTAHLNDRRADGAGGSKNALESSR